MRYRADGRHRVPCRCIKGTFRATAHTSSRALSYREPRTSLSARIIGHCHRPPERPADLEAESRVDPVGAPGDEAGIVARELSNKVRDLLRLPDAVNEVRVPYVVVVSWQ